LLQEISINMIARMRSDFASKFGIPRQSGLVEELRSTIVFEPEYRNADALRGIEDFSHLWVIWQFSEAVRQGWSPTVRPPRLGGNTRLGVFATRSPFRPNNLGLSCVRLIGTEHTEKYGTVLHVGGADLMDGTPIFEAGLGGRQTPIVSGNVMTFITNQNKLVALDRHNGRVFWQQDLTTDTAGAGWYGPVATDKGLIVASSAGDIVVLNPANGQVQQQTQVAPIAVAPVVAGGRLVILTQGADILIYK